MHKTVVFVTHDVGEALLLGDRIALMESGKLRTVATPQEFLHSPDEVAQNYVAAYQAERIGDGTN
jgi:glycine betaine/proline transport system ATP-binding protein